MSVNRRDLWTQIQKAETLLIHAGLRSKGPLTGCTRWFLNQYELSPQAEALLLRGLSGFDPDHLRPADYVLRYPFSSVAALLPLFDQLVEGVMLTQKSEGVYAVTDFGREAVKGWHDCTRRLLDALDLGPITDKDIQTLLTADRRIVDHLAAANRPHGFPLLHHRLKGMQPDYAPPQRYHHWQYVWTMLAASEDEEEYQRQQSGLDPLQWFVRRQLWLSVRRPWRVWAGPLTYIVEKGQSYAPFENAAERIGDAVASMQKRKWMVVDGDTVRLTEKGLQAADADEKKIDGQLLRSWPRFTADEAAHLYHVVTGLNAYLSEVYQANEP